MPGPIVVVGIGIAVYILVYYNIFKGPKCKSFATLVGKTAVITGGNTGIGKATALDLAKRGARVILACRSKQRAEAAVFDIRKESSNHQVLFMQLDLASLQSVRSFAETFLQTEPWLDILINNAGVGGHGQTADGFELHFGVNHLGHFLLTALLLERLKQAEAGRVVTVSSMAYRYGRVDFSTLGTPVSHDSSSWVKTQGYCHSKLCNILFTRELANKLEGSTVTCYSVHPGFVYTEVFRDMETWQKLFFIPFARLFFQGPEGGAQTSIHCAVQEGIEVLSGRYFADCSVQEVGTHARDDGVARKLWEVSERLAGLV
ncbi:dehydrogenase/reductase SDR family member 13-like [Acipenser ruthenus]|uniref:dehydrogenase/reductase SDR family member 13-like n=1 Tax=Acipenser ruthenus TaxID=7906 RepID=UPI00274155AA|nr:dehydrogenase/reductase SDR family member 13-like [Acipenser ruthenus]